MRRQARLFALVEYLRGRRSGVTAEQLAERFGTSARTMYRDLETLRDGDLPLRADRGRGGGYALDRTYSLPPVNFNAREAAVLLTLGRWAAEMRFIPFVDTLHGALDKVRGALTRSAQRDLVEHLRKLQFVGVPSHATAPAVRRAVEQAWFERRPLSVEYKDADGKTSRRLVHIDTVLMDRSLTQLTCIEVDGGARRTFRLDRIQAARLA